MRILRRCVVAVVIMLGIVLAVTATWIAVFAGSHVHRVADAPRAPVAIVPGAKIGDDGKPTSLLADRLDSTIDLLRAGRISAILVSGDGDETAAMTGYLVERGVAAARIVGDPHGLSTRDSCVRAARTYGVRAALIVTQQVDVQRAVAVCRDAGLDVDGVAADCECGWITRARYISREVVLDYPKAVIDIVREPEPAVQTPPTDALQRAIGGI